jgi:hypothetical protein
MASVPAQLKSNSYLDSGRSHFHGRVFSDNDLDRYPVEVRDMHSFMAFLAMLQGHLQLVEEAFRMKIDAAPAMCIFQTAAEEDPAYEAWVCECKALSQRGAPKDYMPHALKKAIVLSAKFYHYITEAQLGGYVTVVDSFFPGASCEITGLVAAAQHNGTRCKLHKYHEDTGRWDVMLQNGVGLAVKTGNLKVIWDIS